MEKKTRFLAFLAMILILPITAFGGDPSAFVSPCFPVPANRTPHDGIDNDGGWATVDFKTAGNTGSGQAQDPDRHHNDDDSADLPLMFTFDFYGTSFGDGFINNNGNLSFGSVFSTFSSSGFPVNNFPMVAPFWGDVDTGDQNDDGGNHNTLGHIWVKDVGSNTTAVTWDNVGYYNEQSGLLNTFQVVLSDGTNAAMAMGTTGKQRVFLLGSGGFGGTPATVGANRGDGVDFFQIGRFDHAGADYDGPGGNANGWTKRSPVLWSSMGTP